MSSSHPTTTSARTVPLPRQAHRIPRQVGPRSRADVRGAEQRGPRPSIGTVLIDDVPISSVSEADVVDHVMDELHQRRGGVIATPNVDIMRGLALGRAPELVEEVDLLVPDGMPLIWASRLQGEPLKARVTGADLFWSLSGAAADRGESVFLLGGGPGVAARAAEALISANPRLKVAGVSSPAPGFETDQQAMTELHQELVEASPDIVFVALGFPRQEQLALRLRQVLPEVWFLGCGGAVDMAAGDRRRAPRALQAVGMEWLHRMALEPRRLWQRYLVHDLPFVLGLLARSGRRRLSRSMAPRTATRPD